MIYDSIVDGYYSRRAATPQMEAGGKDDGRAPELLALLILFLFVRALDNKIDRNAALESSADDHRVQVRILA